MEIGTLEVELQVDGYKIQVDKMEIVLLEQQLEEENLKFEQLN